MSIKPEAIIYTDGSCLKNPGPGGWGAVVTVGKKTIKLSGGAPRTTNNRMELTGAIQALSSLRGPHMVKLHTDSKYLVDAFAKGWVRGWKSRGWAKADGELKNKDLWVVLDKLAQKHTIEWIWVKGHAGNKLNELCDQMAVAAAKQFEAGTASPEMYLGTQEDMELPQEDQQEGQNAPENQGEDVPSDQPSAEPMAPAEPEGPDGQLSMMDTPAFGPVEPMPAHLLAQGMAMPTAPVAWPTPSPAVMTPDRAEAQTRHLKNALRTVKAAFGLFIQEANVKATGIPFPCGGELWCEYCTDMEPEVEATGCRCVDAYIAWRKAEAKARVAHE